jgi:glycosyltransferase involved in cell wall biosynthesis
MSTCTWLLAAGDFTPYGGMDRANFALASYLARRDGDVHLVSHQVSPDLARLPGVHVHNVARPLGMHTLGEPMLKAAAERLCRQLASPAFRALANGGNADLGDLNWVHYVHAAFEPPEVGLRSRLRARWSRRRYLTDEEKALGRARLVICNSRRTAEDVVRLGVPRDRTMVVYYGTDASAFGPVTPAEREAARRALGLPPDRPVALFAGALGDRRKAFDTVFESWRTLCARPGWDVDLAVAGTGAELEAWKARAARELPPGRVRFLGFRRDMPAVFAASDLLIHPARYEAYGLAVHEALCRGLPAIVTASAGVAERYPAHLGSLLLNDPDDGSELTDKLECWRRDGTIRDGVLEFASRLRSRTWDHMAQEIVAAAESVRRD